MARNGEALFCKSSVPAYGSDAGDTLWGSFWTDQRELEGASGDNVSYTTCFQRIFYICRTASVLVYGGQLLPDMRIIRSGRRKLGQMLSYFYICRTASVLVYGGQLLADMRIIPTGRRKLGQMLSYFLYMSDKICPNLCRAALG